MARNYLGNKWRNRIVIGTAAMAITLSLGTIPAAIGAPGSKEERIAQLESQIAQNRVRADKAALAVDETAAAYAAAFDELSAAQAVATAASEKAKKAAEEADAAKAKLGLLAVAKYRQDKNNFAGFEAVTETDAFHTQALKQEVNDILGAQADDQAQGLTALQNVAEVLQDEAARAIAGKKAAAENLAQTERSARAEAESAVEDLQNARAEREKIIVELAKAREVSLAQERERQAKVEAVHQAALAAAAEKKRAEEAALAAREAEIKKAQDLRDAQARAQREAAAAAKAQAEAQAAQQARADAQEQARAQQAAQQAQQRANQARQKAQQVAQKPATTAPSGAAATGAGGALLNWAKGKIGLPYIWGGNGPGGYDCSGLIYAGMQAQGRNIARVASGQYSSLANVSYDQRQPGDLIFYSSNGSASGVYHVGIYAGNGQMLHAPSPGRNIAIVPIYSPDKIMPYVARL